MRKIEERKAMCEKVCKTINFEKVVLDHLEDKSRKAGTTVSNMVNLFCRRIVLNDVEYYREQAKQHLMKFHEMEYLKEQAESMVSLRAPIIEKVVISND